MTAGRRLVIDCDPGCDDALALLLAFGSGLYSTIDIQTVAGNVGIRQATANALRICSLAQEHGMIQPGVTVKVRRGRASSLRGEEPSAASVHGRDGLGDVPLRALLPSEVARGHFLERMKGFLHPGDDASEFYADSSRPSGLPDLVCIGPLTNIAEALLRLSRDERQTFWNKWERVVVMGGAYGVPGNISYAAEFNVHADPDALGIVLQSWREHVSGAQDGHRIIPLVIVPLDLTERVVLWEPSDRIDSVEDELRRAVLCLLRKYFLFHAMNYSPPLNVKKADRLAKKGASWPQLAERCWPKSESSNRSAAEEVRQEFEKSRRAGSAGLKKLPRWCFLHDPIAVWVAMNWTSLGLDHEWSCVKRRVRGEGPDVTVGCSVLDIAWFRVEQGRGEGRGHLYSAEPRQSFLSSRSPSFDAQDARGDLLWAPVISRQFACKLRSADESGFLCALDKATRSRSQAEKVPEVSGGGA